MKYSAFCPIVAGLVLGGMVLPGTAFAEKKTPFTSTETDTEPNFTWLTGMAGTSAYVFDGSAKFKMESADEPRVAGSGSYSMYGIVDLNTGATTVWGKLHIENADGAWDGYWTGTEDGFTATCVGGGDYEGLVSRWAGTSQGAGIYNWRGYIVENGPGDVPFKISGWRVDQFEPLMIDADGNPVYVKAHLYAGGGQASHIGVFTDFKKVGLVSFAAGMYSATGTLRAANGDLVNWVASGTMAGPPAVEAFFVGGTGRFEHAVGSFAGPMEYQSPVSYTYKGPGTIRY